MSILAHWCTSTSARRPRVWDALATSAPMLNLLGNRWIVPINHVIDLRHFEKFEEICLWPRYLRETKYDESCFFATLLWSRVFRFRHLEIFVELGRNNMPLEGFGTFQ
jgi:hypothetical protein